MQGEQERDHIETLLAPWLIARPWAICAIQIRSQQPGFAIAMLAEQHNLPYVGKQSVIFRSTSGTLRDPDDFAGQWRRTRDELGVPDVSSHSFRKTVATLMDDAGLSARIGADDLGHAKVSMTQYRYTSRGRIQARSPTYST